VSGLSLHGPGFPSGWFVPGASEPRWKQLEVTLDPNLASNFQLKVGWAPNPAEEFGSYLTGTAHSLARVTLEPPGRTRILYVDAYAHGKRIAEASVRVVPRWHAWLATAFFWLAVGLAVARIAVAVSLLTSATLGVVTLIFGGSGIAAWLFAKAKQAVLSIWKMRMDLGPIPPHAIARLTAGALILVAALWATSLLVIIVNRTALENLEPHLGVALKPQQAGLFTKVPAVPTKLPWTIDAEPLPAAELNGLISTLRWVISPTVYDVACRTEIFIQDPERVLDSAPTLKKSEMGALPRPQTGKCEPIKLEAVVLGQDGGSTIKKDLASTNVVLGVTEEFSRDTPRIASGLPVRIEGKKDQWVRLPAPPGSPSYLRWSAARAPFDGVLPARASAPLEATLLDGSILSSKTLGAMTGSGCGEKPQLTLLPFARKLAKAVLEYRTPSDEIAQFTAEVGGTTSLLLCAPGETGATSLSLYFPERSPEPRAFSSQVPEGFHVRELRVFAGSEEIGSGTCPDGEALTGPVVESADCYRSAPSDSPVTIWRPKSGASWKMPWACWKPGAAATRLQVGRAIYLLEQQNGVTLATPKCGGRKPDCYFDGRPVRPDECQAPRRWIQQLNSPGALNYSSDWAACSRVFVCN
jgi:hypothetical protein